MVQLAALGTGLYFLVNLALAIRLLLLARRTRGVPELTLGIFFLFGTSFGYTLVQVVFWYRVFDGAIGSRLAALCIFNVLIGTASLLLFTWRVFRPHERWAALTCGGGVALLLAAYAWKGLLFGFSPTALVDAPHNLANLVRASSFGWVGAESLAYYRRMRAQVRLGLAEPLAPNRFLLWGVACSVLFAGFLTHMGFQILAPQENFSPGFALLISIFGVSFTVLFWIAFFPPGALRRRIEARAAQA